MAWHLECLNANLKIKLKHFMALDMNRNHLTALVPLLHFLGDEYVYYFLGKCYYCILYRQIYDERRFLLKAVDDNA